jgi:hypothetical protein
MKKRASSWKKWGLSIKVWQVVFMSQALKPKGIIGNGLSNFWLVF